jgi:hypothetical protein
MKEGARASDPQRDVIASIFDNCCDVLSLTFSDLHRCSLLFGDRTLVLCHRCSCVIVLASTGAGSIVKDDHSSSSIAAGGAISKSSSMSSSEEGKDRRSSDNLFSCVTGL